MLFHEPLLSTCRFVVASFQRMGELVIVRSKSKRRVDKYHTQTRWKLIHHKRANIGTITNYVVYKVSTVAISSVLFRIYNAYFPFPLPPLRLLVCTSRSLPPPSHSYTSSGLRWYCALPPPYPTGGVSVKRACVCLNDCNIMRPPPWLPRCGHAAKSFELPFAMAYYFFSFSGSSTSHHQQSIHRKTHKIQTRTQCIFSGRCCREKFQ